MAIALLMTEGGTPDKIMASIFMLWRGYLPEIMKARKASVSQMLVRELWQRRISQHGT